MGEQGPPQCVLFADGIAQKEEEEALADLENHLGRLHQALEPNGLRITRDTTREGNRDRTGRSSSVVNS